MLSPTIVTDLHLILLLCFNKIITPMKLGMRTQTLTHRMSLIQSNAFVSASKSRVCQEFECVRGSLTRLDVC